MATTRKSTANASQQSFAFPPTEPEATNPVSAQGRGNIVSYRFLLLVTVSATVLFVAQLTMTMSMQWESRELAKQIGEYRAREAIAQEMLQKASKCECPQCPRVESEIVKSLTSIHDSFEATSQDLSQKVQDVDKRITGYGKKFETMIKKLKENPMLKQFGIGM